MRESMIRFGMTAFDQSRSESQVFSVLVVAAKYDSAKKFLAERGWTAAQIDAMPALQAVFMQELFEYDRFYDLLTRGANLPYFQGQRVVQDGVSQLKKATSGPAMGIPMAARMFLPAIEKVFLARLRADRQIAALRTVEAIRLYAAANGGKLPANLDAIAAVPVPLDPVNGQPFQYVLAGDKATLIGLPAGESPNNAIRYEISIGK
jgi:hypothetical protein